MPALTCPRRSLNCRTASRSDQMLQPDAAIQHRSEHSTAELRAVATRCRHSPTPVSTQLQNCGWVSGSICSLPLAVLQVSADHLVDITGGLQLPTEWHPLRRSLPAS